VRVVLLKYLLDKGTIVEKKKNTFARASELLPWWVWVLITSFLMVMIDYTHLWRGVFNPSWWQVLLVVLCTTHITIVGVTMYLHRHQAHRALDIHPFITHPLRLWLWLNTGMVTKEWAAIHRKHHAKCETDEDPHSPKSYGILRVVFAGVMLYVKEASNSETMERYGHGTPDDWIERKVYTPYNKFGVVLLLFIDVLLFGPVVGTFFVWIFQIAWIPFWAAGVINGIGHYFGYRNYKSMNNKTKEEDWSTNIAPWGILIGGEELHNNHHYFPQSARLSSKWYEFDIGWLYIRILESLGLAHVKYAYGSASPGRTSSGELLEPK
jgi:stearoyl-CoA desaturase (delta-9 desaturase)